MASSSAVLPTTPASQSTDAPSDTPTDTPSDTPTQPSPPTETSSDTPTVTSPPSSVPPTTEPPTTSSTSSSSSEVPSSTAAQTTTAPKSTVVTRISTETPTKGNGGAATTIVITSTSYPTQTGNGATSTSGTPSLGTISSGGGHSGLSAAGTIAVAVVVPVVSVALIILGGILYWRKRKARKLAEEERRKEVEDYGYNPNNDPSVPPFGGAAAAVGAQDEPSGYRGWGATSSGRKASTNMSSAPGMAMSEAGSGGPGYYHATSPSDGTNQYSDGMPGEVEPHGILGGVPPPANNRNADIHRGPSNASSAYSGANRSETSEDSHMSGRHPTAPYYDDNAYYNDMHAQYGPYDDGSYGGAQPVIRDVQARRNTRIENPTVVPRQGNSGIAQNF